MAKPKIIVIGASGMVGLATVESLHDRLPVDIVTYDRLADDDQKRIRTERATNYQLLKQYDLLDKQQADWITKDIPLLSAEEKGTISSAHEIDAASCIVITAGIPRKAGRAANEKFSPLVPLNAPYFRELGEQIADTYVQTLRHDAKAVFPIVINTGNPVDTMTELLVKIVSRQLAVHMRAAMKENDTALAASLGKAIKIIPQRIMGQSGIIDGARAAFALHNELNIPLDEIRDVPVLGPHNAHMAVDFEGITAQDRLQLSEAKKEKINQLTRDGAAAVLTDTKEKTGIPQTAVFGTAAAVTKMVHAALGQEKSKVCASIYDPILDQGMGRAITLNHNGAVLSGRALDEPLHQQLQKGMQALSIAFDAAREACGLQQNDIGRTS